jgi:hypothetical protein
MILSGIAVIILLIMLVAREFDLDESSFHNSYTPLPPGPTVYKGSREMSKSKRTSSFGRTSSIHIGHNDLSRLIRHLNGEFVYPPPNAGSQVHRRNKSSKAELDSAYWTKNVDAQSARSSATVLHRVEEEEHPKFVIE